MTIWLGADHGGFELKEALKARLSAAGHMTQDLGAHEFDAEDDYPQFAHAVAEAVAKNPDCRGVLLCRSGAGMVMAANRHPGVRAAQARDTHEAEHARAHNDANVLSLAADSLSEEEAWAVLEKFLTSQADEAERHARRRAAIEP
jgi:ribose 5-phosphate isomerase B